MKRITINQQPMSYTMQEEMKMFRTNIQFCGDDKKVIVVTSCFAGEGKSSISLNLAMSLAELNKKVLLIDGDIRRSVLASVLNVDEVEFGLSHFLSGQCSLADVVSGTSYKKLHVILAGPEVPNPTELLSSSRFSGIIDSFREIYDYVIIDSPPLGIVVDASIIAKECDGAVFVIESGNVKYRMAQQVRDRLKNSGCPILGAVLNKVDYKKNSGYYNKYYGKYGKYYSKGYKKYYGNEKVD